MVQQPLEDERSTRLPPFISFSVYQEYGYLKKFVAIGEVNYDTSANGLSAEGLVCAKHMEYLVGTKTDGFNCPIKDCTSSVLPSK